LLQSNRNKKQNRASVNKRAASKSSVSLLFTDVYNDNDDFESSQKQLHLFMLKKYLKMYTEFQKL